MNDHILSIHQNMQNMENLQHDKCEYKTAHNSNLLKHVLYIHEKFVVIFRVSMKNKRVSNVIIVIKPLTNQESFIHTSTLLLKQ